MTAINKYNNIFSILEFQIYNSKNHFLHIKKTELTCEKIKGVNISTEQPQVPRAVSTWGLAGCMMMLGFLLHKRKDGDVHNGFIITLFTVIAANWAWEF